MLNAFNRASDRANVLLGSVWALLLSVLVVAVWALAGPIFQFSDTWQLAINTGTTVVTFWMVFVIQNSQNRASKAVQLKLDEVIRALDGAENKFIRLEAASASTLAEREAEMDMVADDSARAGDRGMTRLSSGTSTDFDANGPTPVLRGVEARPQVRSERMYVKDGG